MLAFTGEVSAVSPETPLSWLWRRRLLFFSYSA